jgi:hypothetical protein
VEWSSENGAYIYSVFEVFVSNENVAVTLL